MTSKTTLHIFSYFIILFGFISTISPAFAQSLNSTPDAVQMKTYNYADTLQLDFYSIPSNDMQLKPTVVLVHGGGFTAGQRNGGDEKGLSKYLAAKGFNVASINYRLSRKGKSFGCDCPTSIKIDIYVEAVADLSKAINYLTKDSLPFKTDPTKIFLIGSSAGAETVLNFKFMRYDYRFKRLPYPNANIAGVVSLSGAVLDENYIDASNKTPILFFHGVKDSVVPYDTNPHRFCKPTDVGYLQINGPKAIAERLSEIDGSYKVYFNEEGGHEWASLGFKFPELIYEFLADVLRGDATMKDFESITSPISSKK
ncbi:carboxylesterase family protein [Maribacter spongiicola]|uniref:Carboxylesterase family protein n=1 Tax=Maribacter spongiicola TaxID=1206753 RepID=A0A4R7JT52_9FLAO|nr:carboxylesterase family protein [Maribacter spongiicola]TDT40557.1 carboxylesterase family protein [Maribacter spongiicola]